MPRQGWSIRRSQVITTYGVGSMVPVGVESVMVAGTDRWPPGAPDLHEPRLESYLDVVGFRRPPASADRDDLPVVRFPTFVSCPDRQCEVGLDRHDRITDRRDSRCPLCRTDLVPSRFVIACRRGHIDDFPYQWWVHRGVQSRGGVSHDLSISARGTSSTLRDILIACACGAEATMERALSRSALAGWRCDGRRPWLRDDAPERCEERPRTLRRGGSNAWYPALRSALLIPPWSDGAFVALSRHWPVLRVVPAASVRATIGNLAAEGMLQDGGVQYTVDQLTAVVMERRGEAGGPKPPVNESLRSEEFQALASGHIEAGPNDEFVCERADSVAPFCARYFSQVMIVKRPPRGQGADGLCEDVPARC